MNKGGLTLLSGMFLVSGVTGVTKPRPDPVHHRSGGSIIIICIHVLHEDALVKGERLKDHWRDMLKALGWYHKFYVVLCTLLSTN